MASLVLDGGVYCYVVSPALGALFVDSEVDERPFLSSACELITLLESRSVYSERLDRGTRLTCIESTVQEFLSSECSSADHCLDFTGTDTDDYHCALRLQSLCGQGVCIISDDEAVAVLLHVAFIVIEVISRDHEIAVRIKRLVCRRDVDVTALDRIYLIVFDDIVILELEAVICSFGYLCLVNVQVLALVDRYRSVAVDADFIRAESEVSVLVEEMLIVVESDISVVIEHVAVSVCLMDS